MKELIQKNAELIRSKLPAVPEIGLVLGSGLGDLGEKIERPVHIDYADLEGFPVSTAPGHRGRFIFGRLAGKDVLCMQGRVHFYEGPPMESVVLPVRVMRAVGARVLLLTNAAGGVNPDYRPGDLVLLTDHINLMGTNPLIGPNDESLGVRFPDMSFAYAPGLRALAKECAAETGVPLREGVYLAGTGPSYETPAEIRAFRTLGADLVGMSTVPEVIAANHCGLEVLAISLVTNMAAGMLKQPLTEEEVLETGRKKGAELQRLIVKIIEKL